MSEPSGMSICASELSASGPWTAPRARFPAGKSGWRRGQPGARPGPTAVGASRRGTSTGIASPGDPPCPAPPEGEGVEGKEIASARASASGRPAGRMARSRRGIWTRVSGANASGSSSPATPGCEGLADGTVETETGPGKMAEATAGSAVVPRRPRPTETPSRGFSAGFSAARGASISMGSPAKSIAARRRGICRGSSIAIVSSGGATRYPLGGGAKDLRGSGSNVSGTSDGGAGLGAGGGLAPAEGSSVWIDFKSATCSKGSTDGLNSRRTLSSDVRLLTTIRWNCLWICGTTPGSRYT